jgi:hypothetical protein
MNPLIQLKQTTSVFLVALGLACFGFSFAVQAVSPPPDGGYSAQNTAEGDSALLHLTTGAKNTAIGWYSLSSDTTGSYNTGVGAAALDLNNGNENTATGMAALFVNTGSYNTANGAFALFYNGAGTDNTAVGDRALQNNTGGSYNNALGYQALFSNQTGTDNEGFGYYALHANIDGGGNIAIGTDAMTNNQHGNDNVAIGANALTQDITNSGNTAVGTNALADTRADNNTAVGEAALGFNNTGINNTAVGWNALGNNTNQSHNTVVGNGAGLGVGGSSNTILGDSAGTSAGAADNNIYIGANVNFGGGLLFESGAIRIGDSSPYLSGADSETFIQGIWQATVGSGGAFVSVNASGQLGTTSSSARFKKDIESMGQSSEVIFSLRPVSFHYKGDDTNLPCFGLIAEEVAKVNPNLILPDKEGKPWTVRYEQINAMLLNEFLKEHRTVEQQRKDFEAALARQQKQIDALTEGLQKVSAQLELNKSAPQTVLNNH